MRPQPPVGTRRDSRCRLSATWSRESEGSSRNQRAARQANSVEKRTSRRSPCRRSTACREGEERTAVMARIDAPAPALRSMRSKNPREGMKTRSLRISASGDTSSSMALSVRSLDT